MIKNVIFDLGNVLLDFKPERYLNRIIDDRNEKKKLLKNIFQTEEWLELDRGTITKEQAIQKMINRCPSQEKKIKNIMDNWAAEMLTKKEKTVEILNKIASQNNHNLYILSNFHKKAYQFVYRKYPFFDLFDGIVISSDIKSIKPEKEIYEFLLNTYNLKPEASVFIDDTEKNINGAQKLALNTIHYQSFEEFKKELKGYNII